MDEFVKAEDVKDLLNGLDSLPWEDEVEDMVNGLVVDDVAKVVRCKNCVNYCGFEHCKNGICDRDSVSKWAVYPDDFCSYGEKK